MGSSKRLAPYYDMQAQHQAILITAKHGPLQSLTDRELALREQPLTIYPNALQRRARAWVRFGPEAIRVEGKIVRSTRSKPTTWARWRRRCPTGGRCSPYVATRVLLIRGDRSSD